MARRRRPLLVVSAVLLCAVGGSVAAAASPHAKRAGPALIKIRLAKKINRNIVVSSTGLTLYVFTADTGGTSACTDAACMKLWPPPTCPGGRGTESNPGGIVVCCATACDAVTANAKAAAQSRRRPCGPVRRAVMHPVYRPKSGKFKP